MPVLTSQSAPRRSLSRATAVSAAIVILLFFASCLHSAKRDSVSWDESQHLYSGWLSWERGDFGYNPEVPPLVKMWDAIPLLHRDIKQPAFTGDHFKKEGFVLGQRFLVANGIDQTLIPARVMASLLTVFLATLLFFCAREMFGDKAAMFALLLFCLDPNFLAHGAYVTTDIGASLTMLAAVYAFYRYMQRPTVARMIIVGLAVGLAMTAKFTGVFIVPVLCLIAVIDFWRSGTKSPSPRQLITAIVVISLIGVGCIWTLYHFRYAARPSPLQLNPTSEEYLQKLTSPLSRRALTMMSKFHLLPEAYIYGLADTKISAGDLPSYLFGRDYPGAPHWYFPSCFPHQEYVAVPDPVGVDDGCCVSRQVANAPRDCLPDCSRLIHFPAVNIFQPRHRVQASVSDVPDALHPDRGLRLVSRFQESEVHLWICCSSALAVGHNSNCTPGTVGLRE